jgi:hypothetical protein
MPLLLGSTPIGAPSRPLVPIPRADGNRAMRWLRAEHAALVCLLGDRIWLCRAGPSSRSFSLRVACAPRGRENHWQRTDPATTTCAELKPAPL